MSDNKPIDRDDPDLDRAWLGQWIQPQHLTDEALDRYRSEYASGTIPIVRLQQFLRADIAEKLHTLLAEEGEFEKRYGLYDPDKTVTRAEWEAAAESNRLYKFSQFQQARPGAGFAPFVYVKLTHAVGDPRFIAFFERITGTALGPLESFGASAFGAGDYLRNHNDTGFDRRLAFIVYVNPEWQPSFGGALNVLGNGGSEVELEVEYNSLVVFDVHGHKHHYIADIEEAAGDQRRLTVGGWVKDVAAATSGDPSSQGSTGTA